MPELVPKVDLLVESGCRKGTFQLWYRFCNKEAAQQHPTAAAIGNIIAQEVFKKDDPLNGFWQRP